MQYNSLPDAQDQEEVECSGKNPKAVISNIEREDNKQNTRDRCNPEPHCGQHSKPLREMQGKGPRENNFV